MISEKKERVEGSSGSSKSERERERASEKEHRRRESGYHLTEKTESALQEAGAGKKRDAFFYPQIF